VSISCGVISQVIPGHAWSDGGHSPDGICM